MLMKFLILSIFVVKNLCSMVTFVREDFLAPDFDWSQLEVEEHFFRANEECPFVRDEVTVFKYLKLDKSGKPVNTTVTLAKGNEVDIRTFYDETNHNHTGKSNKELLG